MASDVPALRVELDRVRSQFEDWKRRGSPEPEGNAIRARLAGAEDAVVQAIENEPPTAPPMTAPPAPHRRMPTMHTAQNVLDKETDARFWAQTGYRVGQKLDPSDPHDKAMMKTWIDTFAKVKAEDEAGKLVLTYNHPEVVQHLTDAHVADQATAIHLDAAATAPDPQSVAEHVKAAATAMQVAAAKAADAAALQPPTVSPEVAHASATEAAAAAGSPPPEKPAYGSRHPAATNPSARPAIPQTFLSPTGNQVTVFPLKNARDHMAAAQAQAAPGKAVDAHGRGTYGGPRGGVHPRVTKEARELAKAAARAHATETERFVGVRINRAGDLETFTFPNSVALYAWYGPIAESGEYVYIAAFDPDERPGDLDPAADDFHVIVTAAPPGPPGEMVAPAPSPSPVATQAKKSGAAMGIAIGAAAALAIGLAVYAASKSGAPRRKAA